MSKVTSKLQVTIPKAIAERYRIAPGDEVVWVAAGDAVRVVPARAVAPSSNLQARLRLFDRATQRQRQRQGTKPQRAARRGWSREDLYDRGRSR
jgi:AbrB family looped-hinge helix DNA binding protein